MEDISFSKRRKNRGYTYLCTGSAMCVSLLRAPQYSTFACCLIPVLTLIVLRLMLDDIDDISFTKRRNFLIVSWMSISVYCIPTRDTHITRDMCMGIHISRGYSYHCDTGNLGIIFTGDTQYPPCESGGRRSFDCIGQRKSTKRLDRRVTWHTVYNDISAFSRVWMAGVGGTNASCQLNFGHFSVVSWMIFNN